MTDKFEYKSLSYDENAKYNSRIQTSLEMVMSEVISGQNKLIQESIHALKEAGLTFEEIAEKYLILTTMKIENMSVKYNAGLVRNDPNVIAGINKNTHGNYTLARIVRKPEISNQQVQEVS